MKIKIYNNTNDYLKSDVKYTHLDLFDDIKKNYIDNKQLSLIQGKMAHESILKKGLDRDSYEMKWLKVINE